MPVDLFDPSRILPLSSSKWLKIVVFTVGCKKYSQVCKSQ
ncbi:hypothetical protein FOQG_13218 [Fusarium oxysporum f. sp. raphani 54005]|uniref:Uncharacterized protein n=2 Tax=Fusarium oxysporum TaxID=5507 RepID=X0CIU7_FUSOX|nr:hypothetical protein FOVG_12822 [Fusarium oxysporum f. sp. pisi HDV247]EXK82507.1 hypothetical protein FOQG_13218 [Fusarium oxysporum f. sp. raphani 54005]